MNNSYLTLLVIDKPNSSTNFHQQVVRYQDLMTSLMSVLILFARLSAITLEVLSV